MKGNLQLRILTYVVIAYMLLAFSWWTVLLFQKITELLYHSQFCSEQLFYLCALSEIEQLVPCEGSLIKIVWQKKLAYSRS